MNLTKEIHNFRENQKTSISSDMFILWEYKLSKTDGSKKSLYNILKSDNIYLKFEGNVVVDGIAYKNISELKSNEFFNLLSLYKDKNKKLFNFCNKMLGEF